MHVLDLQNLRFFSDADLVDGLGVIVGGFLQLLLGPAVLVLGDSLLPLHFPQCILTVSAHVSNRDVAVFDFAFEQSHQILAPFLV